MELQKVVDKVCECLPDGFELYLSMENGAACVELYRVDDGFLELPDSADKSLEEQIDDALCVANGWDAA